MLFPELADSGLVGIARLAAGSELLGLKRRVQYMDLETRKWIGRASGRKMPFDWTVNPYRGCEFGCKYCYARYTHEFMELHEPEQFETLIYAKKFTAQGFRDELVRIPKREAVAIGTATDPYQPAERRFELTRKILSIFADERGRKLSLATKSDLIARDADLLGAIARQNDLHVCVTITTVDERLARTLEPYAPRPELRLRAIRTLADRGVTVSVLACPVMPLINDSEASLRAVAADAKAAGAVSISGNVLFLKPCAQKSFFPMLEREFPHLLRRYRERYERDHFLRSPEYLARIRERISKIRDEVGLQHLSERHRPDVCDETPQLTLFESRSLPPDARAAPSGRECG